MWALAASIRSCTLPSGVSGNDLVTSIAVANLLIAMQVALFGLVHLGIPLPRFVLGGAGRCDQGGVNDRALTHRHALRTEMGLDGVKDLITKSVFPQQVAEGQDRRFIRNPVTDQVNARKAAHSGNLDQRLLHGWIA